MRSIANHVRPDRQSKINFYLVFLAIRIDFVFELVFHQHVLLPPAMLFSATFRKKVERLCRDVLTDPVRIVVGGVGEANEDITQVTEVMTSDQDKWAWLLKHLVEFTSGMVWRWVVQFQDWTTCFLICSWQCVGVCDSKSQR